jgi:hypothetical protein
MVRIRLPPAESLVRIVTSSGSTRPLASSVTVPVPERDSFLSWRGTDVSNPFPSTGESAQHPACTFGWARNKLQPDFVLCCRIAGSSSAGSACASPSHRASLLGRAVKWRGNGQKSDGIPLNGAVPARPFANTRRTPNPAFGGSARSARLGPSRRRRGSRRYGTPRAGAHRRCIPAHRDERKLRLSAAGAPARHRGSAP